MNSTENIVQSEANLEEQVSQLSIEETKQQGGRPETQGKHRQRGSRGSGSGKKKENTSSQPQADYNPTALVVKNIHLGIDRDTFLQAMEELGLPKPFAFNYYYEDGAFRGLAFLNYRTTQDAQLVLTKLNGTELSGRKLKVEFKKYAPNSDKNFKPNNNVNNNGNNKDNNKDTNKDNGNNNNDGNNNNNNSTNIKASFNLNLEDAAIRQIFDQVSQFQANFQQQECYFPNDASISKNQPNLFEIIAHKLNLHYSIDPELNCVKLSKLENQRNPLAKFSRQTQLADEIRKKGGNLQEKRSSSNSEKKREKVNQNSGVGNASGDQSGVESPRGGGRGKNRNSRLDSPSTPNRDSFNGRSPRNSQYLNSTNNIPDPQSPANVQTPPPAIQSRDLEKTSSTQAREAPFLVRNKASPSVFTITPIRQPKGPDLTQNFHSRKFGLDSIYNNQGADIQNPAPANYV